MWTWWSGRSRLAEAQRREELSASEYLQELRRQDPDRVPGTGIFLTEDVALAPIALQTVLEIGHVLPERAVILSWQLADTPTAEAHESRVRVDEFGHAYDGLVSVEVVLGFQERLDVVAVLGEVRDQRDDLADLDPDTAFYFVSSPHPRLGDRSPMTRWRQRLFLLLDELSTDRVAQLRLPRHRTVTVGREFEL
jgi:KUP system potassium uptake protein